MLKKFTLNVLSFVSLATVAQAGHLELVAELSKDQRAAVAKKFVEPYVSTTRQGLTWAGNIQVRYPHLRPLEDMQYTTTLADCIAEEQAQLIAQTYIDSAKSLAVKEISTTPFINTMEPSYYVVGRRSSLEYPETIISPDEEAVVCDLETSLTSNPKTLHYLQQKVIEELGSQVEDLKGKSDSFGFIAFGKTRFFEDKNFGDNSSWTALGEMDKKICLLSSKLDPLTLTFTTFNLRYIEDDGEIKFSMPFNLPQISI